MTRRALLLFVLLASFAALAQTISCPIDGLMMYFTGETRVEMGKMLYKYRCPQGHVTWVVQ